MLHGLVTYITIAATLFYLKSTEGQRFVVDIYTYAYSVLGGKKRSLYVSPLADVSLVALDISLLFHKNRMDDTRRQLQMRESTDVQRGSHLQLLQGQGLEMDCDTKLHRYQRLPNNSAMHHHHQHRQHSPQNPNLAPASRRTTNVPPGRTHSCFYHGMETQAGVLREQWTNKELLCSVQ
jgi:hypothetical protein